VSAGVVLYRRERERLELFLVHPGGPFWSRKDVGAWSFPKGEYQEGEDPASVARREFHEETGFTVQGELVALEPIRQKGGKVVQLFATEGDCDATAIRSNTFTMEWPSKSGRTAEFPEVDRAGWFSPAQARVKLNPAQAGAVDEICARLGVDSSAAQ
jgi:predicted NUDIX family NTP pyrophosphohydrolase